MYSSQALSSAAEVIPEVISEPAAQTSIGIDVRRGRDFKEQIVTKIHRFPIKRRAPRMVEQCLMYAKFKNLFDFFGASALLVAASPVMLIIALAVRLTSAGPVIFKQTRLTQSGKTFTMYKFRTMYPDAEAQGAMWAEKDDPRVTGIGRFLRQTRLDELPQLINVLKGDMSLIGPRPERPEFCDIIVGEIPGFMRRLSVKAGLTGLAQIGNGYTSCIDGYRKKLAWDRLYIQKQSIVLDLWIAVKTVAVMLTGHGAR
jgi:lipopolysaccharide/colanic/teichoic acid biosynthesis glycosyltransferase